MNSKLSFMIALCTVFTFSVASAQRPERHRPDMIRDQIQMKLDSIDQFYVSRLKPREAFGVRRILNRTAVLVDRLEDQLQDRERILRERERLIEEKERAMMEKERIENNQNDRRYERDHTYNRDNDRDQEVESEPMQDQEFDQLIRSLEQAPFDPDKKKIIRTCANNNYFMVDQAIVLASKFSFDNDKLDVIKVLYPRLLDYDKNYLLYNCFTFSDGKNKLEKFIDEQNNIH